MEIKGKKVVFLGDSITEGALASASEKTFVGHFRNAYPESKIYNFGVGGTRIARKREPSNPIKYDWDYIARADLIPSDTDIIIVFGGTNDYGHGDAPLGKETDLTEYTFYGALNLLFTKLKKEHKNAKIGVVTPLTRECEGVMAAGFILSDAVEAQKIMAKKYDLPLLDLYNDPDLSIKINPDNISLYVDGLHPGDVGHELLYKKIDEFIKTL